MIHNIPGLVPHEVGRPRKPYEDSSKISQKRKDLSIEREITFEQSCYIAKKKFKSCGNLSAAKLIEIIKSPENANALYKTSQRNLDTALTPEEALALKFQTRLSCEDYRNLRRASVQKNNSFLPPLYKVKINNVQINLRHMIQKASFQNSSCLKKVTKN